LHTGRHVSGSASTTRFKPAARTRLERLLEAYADQDAPLAVAITRSIFNSDYRAIESSRQTAGTGFDSTSTTGTTTSPSLAPAMATSGWAFWNWRRAPPTWAFRTWPETAMTKVAAAETMAVAAMTVAVAETTEFRAPSGPGRPDRG
jgi:hypothetical protein